MLKRTKTLRSSAACLVWLVACAATAHALSVQTYEAMESADQSGYLVKFLEKMTFDIGQKDPTLAAKIKDYYVHKQPGKPYSEGIEQIEVELAVLDRKARLGQVDLTRIQIEGVVVGVTTRKFPPDQTSTKSSQP